MSDQHDDRRDRDRDEDTDLDEGQAEREQRRAPRDRQVRHPRRDR